jgi:hypothetical protein
MNAVFLVLGFLISCAIALTVDGGLGALLICLLLAIPALLIINQADVEYRFFLRNIFLGGLLLRIFLGFALYKLGWSYWFGPDAQSYDLFADSIIRYWYETNFYRYDLGIQPNNMAMSYLSAFIYLIIGRTPFALQLFNTVLGAATGPIIFYCSYLIFRNLKVSRISAYLVTFFPSLVLWSSLGLKDGPIVFLIALTMLCTLHLLEKFSFLYVVILLLSLFSLLGLRFYIAYLIVIAIIGGFVIGSKNVMGFGFLRQVILLSLVGVSITYFGIMRNAPKDIEQYSDLNNVQNARSWGAKVSESGFGRDADVSTTQGAIAFMPIGLVFVLFAPFPWQMTSFSQIITLPEMLIWWGTFPFLISGLIYSIRYKLRNTSPVLLFTVMLTLVYSLIQNNVGTVYRQRSQLLIFYLIFTAVGIVLWQERKENRKQESKHSGQRHYQFDPQLNPNQR